MSPPKKPPPDDVGNLRGRMQALRLIARQRARMDEGEYVRALGRRMKEIEPQLNALRKRLAVVRKSEEAPKEAAPRGARTPAKDRDGNLLDTLGSL